MGSCSLKGLWEFIYSLSFSLYKIFEFGLKFDSPIGFPLGLLELLLKFISRRGSFYAKSIS